MLVLGMTIFSFSVAVLVMGLDNCAGVWWLVGCERRRGKGTGV